MSHWKIFTNTFVTALSAAILGLMTIGFGYALFGKDISKPIVEHELERANYCTADSDCAVIPGKCPLGCYVLVNTNEVERTEAWLDAFTSNCVYSCTEAPAYSCLDNVCVWERDQR